MKRKERNVAMAVRPIVVVPHEVLNTKAREIEEIDEYVRKLAHDMADTMYQAPGIGLAANQVGEPLRLVVVDVQYAYAEPKDKKKDPIIVLNPRITTCEGEEIMEEGCLSVPDFNVEVARSQCVRVEGVSLDGKPVEIEAEGLLARVLQHEIDHLDGTTLLEHASALKRNLYRRRLKKKARRAS
jgi:peptide deformylase